jgi:serine/threonine protein kinase/tetratricopeptide (TPR) repeat protein
MTAERWKHVQTVLQQALVIDDSNARDSWLKTACGPDDALLNEVESLLAAYAPAQNFLEGSPIEGQTGGGGEETTGLREGQRLGAYRLNREIGHGGMGTVFLAARADDQYQMRVAIKVIRRGMNSDAIVRRFRRERQILAALQHPQIARFFDGGVTDEGQPYLVMEYIDGQPIDEFCDSRRLGIDARLQLFRLVCSAVQYAHRNLVVHQDIKPANILVTAEGIPKLLDFGVAKLLNPELGFIPLDQTVPAQAITPEYASPEQVKGEPITTATDVYSLGVMLYRLLTGHHLYRIRPRVNQEMFRLICEEEPTAPSNVVNQPLESWSSDEANQASLTPEKVSEARAEEPATLSRRLRGDLDNLVLKALCKEPDRRYSSPEQLSDDIHRYLGHLPVIARRGTLAYRAEKFVRRHRLGVACTAVGVILFGAGVAAIVRETGIARAERSRAERRFNDVRRLANSYLFEFHDAIENLPGSTPARALLVTRALEYLDNLSQESGGDLNLQRELAAAYQRVGNVQGQPAFANLGDTDGALKSYDKALAIRQKLVQADSSSIPDKLALAEIYRLKGNLLAGSGRSSDAFASVREALRIDRGLAEQKPGDAGIQTQLAMAAGATGDLEYGMGVNAPGAAPDAAIQHWQEALRIYEAQLSLDPANPVLERRAAVASVRVGDAFAKVGRREAALASYRRSLSYLEPVAAGTPNSEYRRDLANAWYRIGTVLIQQGNFAGARAAYEEALPISQELASADSRNAQAKADLAYGYADIGEATAREGKLAEGLSAMGQGIRMMEQVVAANPGNARVRENLMQTCVIAGELAQRLGPGRGAEFFAEAQKTASTALAANPGDGEARAVLDRVSQTFRQP